MQNVHEYINNIDEEIIWTPIKNDDGAYTHERSNRGEVRKDKWIDLKHVYRIDGTKIDMPPGFYEASTMGNVRSTKTKKIRKLELSHAGYLQVALSYFKRPGDKTKTISPFYVHRVIRFAFLSHDVTLPYVHHRDANRANNSLSNLVPCTQKYNMQQTLKTRKLTNKEVEKYNIDTNGQPTNTVKYKSIKDATAQCGFFVRAFLYGIHKGSVDQDGFFWKFTHPQPIKLTINELIPDSFRELLPDNPGHYIVKDDPRGVIYSARLQRFLTVIDKDDARKTYPHIRIRGRAYFIHELMHDYFVTSETTELLAGSGKKLVIHHLDNDGKNFDVDNLTRTTQAANVQASYDDGHRLAHTHVLQISLDTNTVVAEYVSASAAARVLKVKAGANINNVCLGNRKQAHNAFWVRATNDNCVKYNYELGTKLITAPPKTRNTDDTDDDDDGYQPLSFNVIQINPTTNTVVAEYMSASSAGRILKLAFGSVIGQACNGKIKTVRKCTWERATIDNCAKYNYTLGTKLVVESSTDSV